MRVFLQVVKGEWKGSMTDLRFDVSRPGMRIIQNKIIRIAYGPIDGLDGTWGIRAIQSESAELQFAQ